MTFATLARRPRSRRPVPLFEGFERLVDGLYRDFPTPPTLARPARTDPSFAPRVTVKELENEFRVAADVPGVDAKDLDVDVEDGVLTIRGVRYWPEEVHANESADAATERPGAKFARRIAFRSEIVEDGVDASLKNGVLTVTVPKPTAVTRTIPVETA